MNKHAYTIEETADTLGLSKSTVEGLIRRKELSTITVGRSVRVTHRQLDEFLQRAERGESIATDRTPPKDG